jgi:hypothetical protein
MAGITAARPSPALVVGVLALVAALGGTAVAEEASTSDTPVTKKKVRKIAKRQINRLAPGLSVAHADTAARADELAGAAASEFQTASASDERTETPPLPQVENVVVLEATITIPVRRTVTAFAAIEANSEGQGNSMSCNLNIAGVDGVRQTTAIPVAPTGSTMMPLTQARRMPSGSHVVRAECSKAGTGAVDAGQRSLSVVATG